ncbi:HAD hydrolase-like protein [Nitratireductor sp. ZSWI3]|uniref:HAD hydrolase-like protein n=1 Tax=Nitratireductor sp. ZSWI3 TaxID=2966359 RepID=UPI00214FDA7B|nr:HAD hydrolase-like protein [Nitratireductor sp. ZSWI3]MCR4268591.1 HAD hydrolase-like protein [Nitratireductor sp. ZSWI3]
MIPDDRRAAVLFDLDGTLTDPFVGITNCIRHAMEKMGRAAPEADALRAHIGPPLQVTFAQLLETDDEVRIWEAVGHYRDRYSQAGKFENVLIPGVTEVLARCIDAGYFLSLATSKLETYSRDILDHFDLTRFFDAIHGSAADGTRADKAHLIEHILSVEPIEAAGAVMIGDRHHDVHGAKANDVPTIGVLWGFGDRAELVQAGAVGICETPAALAAAIDDALMVRS